VPFGVSDPEDVDFRTHGGALIPSGPDEETAALATAGDQLLQAGYDEITPLPALELLYTDTERHAATARALAEQWMNRLNITVTPVAVTAEELNTALEAGTFSLALTDFTGYINDAQGFMDAWTIDTQRVSRCNLGVQYHDGRTIPFCAYHLTDSAGNRLYPYPVEEE